MIMRMIVLCGAVLSLGGCTGVRSQLAGRWSTPEPPGDVPRVTVHIRGDGSFDWSRTMWGHLAGGARLVHPGDRARSCWGPYNELRLVWRDYEPTRTRFVLIWDYTDQLGECPPGPRQFACAYYDARLTPAGGLDLTLTMVESTRPPEIYRATLERTTLVDDAIEPVCGWHTPEEARTRVAD
jgi:hypothetical protein